jgi:hypothetical protein
LSKVFATHRVSEEMNPGCVYVPIPAYANES